MLYEQEFHELHFDSIQALRGIAAILVVFEHVRFFHRGAFGVDIFFIISGFIIMFTTHGSTEFFFRKRLLRIIPFYYLMTAVSFLALVLLPGLFEQTAADPVYLVKSLLFIPFDIGGGVLQPLLRIGWTVNCEMFFYLLFGISLRISRRLRGLVCSLLLLGTWAAAALLPSRWAPLTFYGNPVMLEFALGILCYYIARGLYGLYRRQKLTPVAAPLCAAAACGLILCLILTVPYIDIAGLRRPLLWGLPALTLVLCFYTAGLFLRTPRLLVMLGNISFSVYLVHYYPILFIDRKICSFAEFSAASLTGALLSAAAVLLLSLAAWFLIEKRFTGWLRGKLDTVSPKPQSGFLP